MNSWNCIKSNCFVFLLLFVCLFIYLVWLFGSYHFLFSELRVIVTPFCKCFLKYWGSEINFISAINMKWQRPAILLAVHRRSSDSIRYNNCVLSCTRTKKDNNNKHRCDDNEMLLCNYPDL